jgi:hypothetical protein
MDKYTFAGRNMDFPPKLISRVSCDANILEAFAKQMQRFRGQIVSRRMHGSFLAFITIDLHSHSVRSTFQESTTSTTNPPTTDTTEDPPLDLSHQLKLPKRMSVCFSQRDFETMEADSINPPAAFPQSLPLTQLPFPVRRQDLNMGDVVECVCVWSPPEQINAPSIPPEGDWTSVIATYIKASGNEHFIQSFVSSDEQEHNNGEPDADTETLSPAEQHRAAREAQFRPSLDGLAVWTVRRWYRVGAKYTAGPEGLRDIVLSRALHGDEPKHLTEEEGHNRRTKLATAMEEVK